MNAIDTHLATCCAEETLDAWERTERRLTAILDDLPDDISAADNANLRSLLNNAARKVAAARDRLHHHDF